MVQWDVNGFTGPFSSNAVAWGQTSLLGQTPGVQVAGNLYEAVVDVPAIHGTLNVIAFAEDATSGLVTSTVVPVDVSVFEALTQLWQIVETLQADSVSGLSQHVQVTVHNGLPVVRVAGANLQVVDGTESTITDPPNGLGNVIVGYDEPRSSGPSICSDGQFDNEVECVGAGGVWGFSHKTGSHNLIVGIEQNYADYGGVLFGRRNSVTAASASVTGGSSNVARGVETNIGGGSENTAVGSTATVTGGMWNFATGHASSVSGGENNQATGATASVSGGALNIASGINASVSGGQDNTASGITASVSGGYTNSASNAHASVSGGVLNNATGPKASVGGGAGNTASGEQATVSGGANRSAPDIDDWVGGGLFQSN